MNKNLLYLTPKRFLCPYCGQWHEWTRGNLFDCESKLANEMHFECAKAGELNCPTGEYTIEFRNDVMKIETESICGEANLHLKKIIPIDSIIEDSTRPIVTFKINFRANRKISTIEGGNCGYCPFLRECNMYKLCREGDNFQNAVIELGFEFDESEYYEATKRKCFEEEMLDGAKSADYVQDSMKSHEKATNNRVREGTFMKNLLNNGMTFGPSQDSNIASTLMGVAVYNGGSWRIYNKEKQEMMDVGDMKLGDFPVYILPATDLEEGDLIKDGDEYYFVIDVKENCTRTLSATTGEFKDIIPVKNILGISIYSKVATFADSLDLGMECDLKTMVLLSSMFGQPGAENGGQNMSMNNMLPLLLLSKDGVGKGKFDKKTLMLMAMMNGGDAAAGNNMMMLLMMDSLMGDKDK